MRYDLNILWVEDTSTYYEEAKEILEGYAEESGISVKFYYIQDVNDFYKKMSNNEDGFKLFDIYFIDYSLSWGIVGSELITMLRTKKINADILFYSSDKEKAIRETIEKDVGSFEGVYVANKNNFDDKSYMLISKNAKRLTSLSNIRENNLFQKEPTICRGFPRDMKNSLLFSVTNKWICQKTVANF